MFVKTDITKENCSKKNPYYDKGNILTLHPQTICKKQLDSTNNQSSNEKKKTRHSVYHCSISTMNANIVAQFPEDTMNEKKQKKNKRSIFIKA